MVSLLLFDTRPATALGRVALAGGEPGMGSFSPMRYLRSWVFQYSSMSKKPSAGS